MDPINRFPCVPLGGPSSHAGPRVEGRLRQDGSHGLYASQPIAPNEPICVFGGTILDEERLGAVAPERRRLLLQVAEGLYMYSDVEGPADWVNHSCEPNAGFRGQIVLVAMRSI